jgi:hypothetical protein
MTEDQSDFWTWIMPGQSPGHDAKALRLNFDVLEVPRSEVFMLAAREILARVLGFKSSAETRRATLGDGTPIPLMSYSLIEYLIGIDLSGFDVLELGGGQSTKFWSQRAKSVHTFEHDVTWLNEFELHALPNVELTLPGRDEYVDRLRALEASYDIIVIDCSANRRECAKAVAHRLREGGMVILDNSDWYPNTAAYLRSLDLIQVDFADFRPDHPYRCATSVFLHTKFRPIPAGRCLPAPTLGGKNVSATNSWDQAIDAT